MKLHIPLSIRHALLATVQSIIIGVSVQELLADTVQLNYVTAWDEANRVTPGYVAEGGVGYYSSGTWDVMNGSYNATVDTYGEIGYIIRTSGAMTNNGEIAVSATANGSIDSGLSIFYATSFTNAENGMLEINSVSSNTYSDSSARVYGVEIFSTHDVLNAGVIDSLASSPSSGWATGVRIATSSVSNSGQLKATATEANVAKGLEVTSSSLENSGYITATAIKRLESSYGTSPIGISLYSSALTNRGIIEALAISDVTVYPASTGGTAYGVHLYDSTLDNEAAAKLAIISSLQYDSGHVYGIYALRSSINNMGMIDIDAGSSEGLSVTGVFLNTHNTYLKNEVGGSITISAKTSGGGWSADGIRIFDNDPTVYNAGNITIETSAAIISRCISSINHIYRTLTNDVNGSMELTAIATGEEGEAIGIDYGYVLDNKGYISISASNSGTKGEACGIRLVTASENSGTIEIESASSGQSGWAYGITSTEGITNTGTITVESSSSGISSKVIGIDTRIANSGTVISNVISHGDAVAMSKGGHNEVSGVISACAVSTEASSSATAMKVGELINLGYIETVARAVSHACALKLTGRLVNYAGATISALAISENEKSEAYGIRLGSTLASDTPEFYNAGTLICESVYVESGDSSCLYMLDGSILKGHVDSDGVEIHGTGSVTWGGGLNGSNSVSQISYGSTLSVHDSLSISGVKLDIFDNVTLKMFGDLSIASDVTTTWNGNSLTVDNGGNVQRVTMGDDFSVAWNTAFTMTQDGDSTGVLLKQSEVKENVTLQGGAAKLSDGSLKAIEQLTVGASDAATTLTSATDLLTVSSDKSGAITNTSLTAENVTVSGGDNSYMTLEDSTITIEGGEGALSNVSIEGSSQIIGSGEGVVLTMSNVKVVLNELRCTVGPEMALMALEDEPMPYTSTMTLTTDMLKNVSLSGDLTLDFSGLEDEITTSDNLVFAFDESVDITGLTSVQGTFDGLTYSTGTLSDGVVLFSTSEGSESIPEPTTAALSLLALTGLIARRWRK